MREISLWRQTFVGMLADGSDKKQHLIRSLKIFESLSRGLNLQVSYVKIEWKRKQFLPRENIINCLQSEEWEAYFHVPKLIKDNRLRVGKDRREWNYESTDAINSQLMLFLCPRGESHETISTTACHCLHRNDKITQKAFQTFAWEKTVVSIITRAKSTELMSNLEPWNSLKTACLSITFRFIKSTLSQLQYYTQHKTQIKMLSLRNSLMTNIAGERILCDELIRSAIFSIQPTHRFVNVIGCCTHNLSISPGNL